MFWQHRLADVASGLLQLQRGLIRGLQQVSFDTWHERHPIRHLVIYRVGNLGDTVLALPALYAIRERYPQATLTLLTSPGSTTHISAETVLTCFEPLVNHVVTYLPSQMKTFSGIRELSDTLLALGPIDAFIDLPVSMQTIGRSFKELLFAKWLGAKMAVGFDMIFPPIFQSAYAKAKSERIPSTYQWLLGQLPWSPALKLPKRLPISLPMVINHPLIAINPGAKLPLKQWPMAYFIDTIQAFAQQRPEAHFVLLGSASEHEQAQTIASACPGVSLQNLCGKLSIAETFELLSQAKLVLTNDTGVLHMAGVVGTPVLAPVSGQFPEGLWDPPVVGTLFTALRHRVPCQPCFQEVCSVQNQPCLREIRPEQVIAAMHALLS